MTNTFFDKKSISDSKSTERLKIVFQYLSTVLVAFVIGALISGACSDIFYLNSKNEISAHFNGIFSGINDFKSVFIALARYSQPCIISVLIIFLTSFSPINYLISDIIIFIFGIRCGASVAVLLNLVLTSEFALLHFAVFATFKLFILASLISYSYKAALISLSGALIVKNGRRLIKPNKLIWFIAFTAAYAGAFILINGAYCFIIYLLK